MKKILTIFVMIVLLSGIIPISGQNSTNNLTLSFTNLADPGDDHYEGWLIVDGNPVSTGKFTLDSSGDLVDLDGDSITTFSVETDISLATKFVLTLEPSGDTDTTPAAIKPLAGDINSDKTSADLTHNIGADFSSISGSYILATPTNGADTNENSGIWFLDPTGESPVVGLDLPDLTDTDWTYEGWVVMNGTPVTTGTFDTASGFDDSAPYSGESDGPPFPGEDFLTNAPSGLTFPTNIAGGVAVISIEPRMDNDVAPFQFKPLVADISANAVDHTLYDLDDKSSTLPTGSVSIDTVVEDTDGIPFSTIGLIFGSLFLSSVILIRRRK